MPSWITYILNTAKYHKIITKEVLHISSWITYILNAKFHKIITKRFCTCWAKSLTYWPQPDATKLLPRGCAHIRLNDLLSEQSQMPQNCHQEVLHMSSWTTYMLNTARYHKIISKRYCTCQAKNHLHTEDGQMPQDHHQEILHRSSWMTYFLNTARCHKIITKRLFSTCQATSLTS